MPKQFARGNGRNFLKLILILFPLLTLLSLAPPEDNFDDAGYLPPDWYELPEFKDVTSGATAKNLLNGRSIEESNKHLDENLDDILSSQAKAFNEINSTRKKSWKLTTIVTGLSVGINGMVGMTVLSGIKAMEIYWRRGQNRTSSTSLPSDPPLNPIPLPSTTSEPSGISGGDVSRPHNEELDVEKDESANIVISGQMTSSHLKKQLEPSIKAALNLGKIKNEKAFRENLYQQAREFQKVITDLDQLPTMTPWYLSGLRLDVNVTAEGEVALWARVGGDVLIRFIWIRVMPKRQDLDGEGLSTIENPTPLPLKRGTGDHAHLQPLARFVKGMCEDLKALSEQSFQDTKFRPTTIWAGIGMSTSGRVFLASLGSRVAGTLFFTRKQIETPGAGNSLSPIAVARDSSHSPRLIKAWTEKDPLPPATEEVETLLDSDQDYFYVEDAGKREKLAYAVKWGIPHEEVVLNKSGLSQVSRMLYKIKRSKFRSELRKSAHMAKYFINHLPQGGRWAPSTLSFAFDMSVTGNLGLATLSGSAFATVFLKKVGGRP